MRKFLFSGAMISALFGGASTLRATQKGPRDWRLLLQWLIWGLTVAIAVGTVVKQTHDNELEE